MKLFFFQYGIFCSVTQTLLDLALPGLSTMIANGAVVFRRIWSLPDNGIEQFLQSVYY